MVVNTASHCGFTSQLEGLEALYDQYRDRGLVVLGFPSNDFAQEPGSEQEIQRFCELNYGVDFPMFEKTHVEEGGSHPFFDRLVQQDFRGADEAVVNALKARLLNNPFVSPVGWEAAWELGLRRGCVSGNDADNCEDALYLVTPGADSPVLGLKGRVSTPEQTLVQLEEAVTLRAKQHSLRNLRNNLMSRESFVKADLIQLTVAEDSFGRLSIARESLLPKRSLTHVRTGDWYKIKVTNTSSLNQWVAVVVLTSSGRVVVSEVTPVAGGVKVRPGESWSTVGFSIGPPLGAETYKVIATTLPSLNFAALEQPGVARGDDVLALLLNQSMGVGLRDPGRYGELTADSWGTDRIDVSIH